MPTVGNLGTIISAGSDAMSNLYDVYITPPAALAALNQEMNENYLNGYRIRIGDFTPPILGVNEVEVHYKTESYFVPGQIIEGEREFQIPFRVDANYDLYVALLKWRNMFFNSSDGSVGRPCRPEHFGTVLVVANKRLCESNNYTRMPDFANLEAERDIVFWKFTEVWPQSIENPEFSRDDSTPIRVSIRFQFGHMIFRANLP